MKARYAHSAKAATCIKCRCIIDPEDTFVRVTDREWNAELRKYYTKTLIYCTDCYRVKRRDCNV